MTTRYDFSDDWFSHNIPVFERHLDHLRGQPGRLLEIGSHEGRSAIWLLDNIATHPSAQIETIDVTEHPKLWSNLVASGHSGKATFHLGQSADVLRTLPVGSYDFAYIDGCHWTVNVLEDAIHSFRLLKPEGIMAFDDYLWDDPEWNQEGRPREAIDAFLSVYSKKVELLHKDYQAWIKKLSD